MRATVLLVLVNVAVYVVMLCVAGVDQVMHFDTGTLLRFGANRAPLVTDQGEVWRLFTATLVHINLPHVGMNMVSLVQVGRLLEPRWGTARVLIAYVVTGLLGSVASLVIHLDEATVCAGASGAICGLIGATVVMAHLLGPAGAGMRNSTLIWGVMVIVGGFFLGADNAAHIGGFVAGLLVGAVIEKLGIYRRGSPLVDALAMLGFLVLSGGAFTIALAQ